MILASNKNSEENQNSLQQTSNTKTDLIGTKITPINDLPNDAWRRIIQNRLKYKKTQIEDFTIYNSEPELKKFLEYTSKVFSLPIHTIEHMELFQACLLIYKHIFITTVIFI